MEDKKDSSEELEPQPKPEKKKGYEAPKREPIAAKTCNVRLEGRIVALVKGQEVEDLTRQERNNLRFHGFIE